MIHRAAVVCLVAAVCVLFGAGGGQRLCLGDETALTQLIENVKSAERRYENISVSMRSSYATTEYERKTYPSNRSARLIEWNLKQVSLGPKFRLDIQGKLASAERENSLDRIHACDGTRSRILEQGAIGNIRSDCYPDWHRFRPHMLAYIALELPEPLSARMEGPQAIIAHGGVPPRNPFEVHYLGREEMGGHPCQKIEFAYKSRDTGTITTRHLLWLADDRNFIPLRFEVHDPGRSKTLPTSVTTVDDFFEVAPGIWSPRDLTVVHYDSLALHASGVQHELWVQKVHVDAAEIIFVSRPGPLHGDQVPDWDCDVRD